MHKIFRYFRYFDIRFKEQKPNTTMIVLVSLAVLCYLLDSSAAVVLPWNPQLPPFVTLEEHFTPAELAFQDAASPLYIQQKLADVDGLRLQEMDEGRITKQ